MAIYHPDGWVTYNVHKVRRQPSRAVLMRALLEEIETGCSEAKLYGLMLARVMLRSDAKLRDRYSQRLAALTDE